MEVLAALVVFLAMIAYLGLTGTMVAIVTNELRLDTYLSISTGVEMVLLFFLLVWAPLLAFRATGGRR
jgi:VIT1/CCC1 family predicted Fe2+/Mn2+ transporter